MANAAGDDADDEDDDAGLVDTVMEGGGKMDEASVKQEREHLRYVVFLVRCQHIITAATPSFGLDFLVHFSFKSYLLSAILKYHGPVEESIKLIWYFFVACSSMPLTKIKPKDMRSGAEFD